MLSRRDIKCIVNKETGKKLTTCRWLAEPEFVETWIWCFAAQARAKILKDNQAREWGRK